MKTPDEIKKGLIEPELFCDHCEYYGEPNGCNRPNGSCKAYDNADDAYKLIQQLESQVPKWISVEERLPEERGNYLVRCYFRNPSASYTYEKIKIIHFRGKTRWATENEYITHWMPLPETPKEAE